VQRGWILAVVSAVLVLSGCGGSSDNGNSASNEAVSVHLVSLTSDDALALEKRLAAKITRKAVGEYDDTRWHSTVDGGEAQLLAYGPDADALWDAMKPIVQGSEPKPGSHVIKTYGDPMKPSAKQVRINLTP
jgi:hypothetical protein